MYLLSEIRCSNYHHIPHWFLCDQCGVTLVGSVHGSTVARSASTKTCGLHAREGDDILYDQSYIQTRNNFSASFQDAFHKNLRRTVMRYVNLSNILVMRQISVKVERQFPDNQALLDAKLLRAPEALRLEKIDAKTPHESRC